MKTSLADVLSREVARLVPGAADEQPRLPWTLLAWVPIRLTWYEIKEAQDLGVVRVWLEERVKAAVVEMEEMVKDVPASERMLWVRPFISEAPVGRASLTSWLVCYRWEASDDQA